MAEMMQKFRAPKAVQDEASSNSGEIASRIAQPLSIDDVVELRTSWVGEHGIDWANRITGGIEERTSVLLKGNPMQERAEGAPDTAADLFTVIDTSIDVIETSIDALKDLLGIVDADEESAVETNSGDIQSVETRVEKDEPMIEERKSAITTAERITMDTEIRAVASNDGSLKVSGYAATFNQEADGLNFREKIAPGAFSRSLASSEPVYLLINHDTDGIPLASTRSGTLVLTEDDHGLRMDANLDPSNPRAQEFASAVKRGDMTKMSFSFTLGQDGDSRDGGVRTLKNLNLFEVSGVTWPAYSSTDLSARSAEIEAETLELTRRSLALKVQLANLRK